MVGRVHHRVLLLRLPYRRGIMGTRARGEIVSMLEKNVNKEGFRSLVLGDERYRPFDGLNQEQEGETVATDKLEDVLQKLDEASLAAADPAALLREDVS